MKNQARHRQRAVPGLAQRDKLFATRLLREMRVRPFLFANRAFPARLAATRLIVVAGEDPRLLRQSQDFLDGAIEARSAAAGEVGARGAAVGHEKRVIDKGRIADDVSYRRQRMPRGEQGNAFDFADPETLAGLEKLIPLRSISR